MAVNARNASHSIRAEAPSKNRRMPKEPNSIGVVKDESPGRRSLGPDCGTVRVLPELVWSRLRERQRGWGPCWLRAAQVDHPAPACPGMCPPKLSTRLLGGRITLHTTAPRVTDQRKIGRRQPTTLGAELPPAVMQPDRQVASTGMGHKSVMPDSTPTRAVYPAYR